MHFMPDRSDITCRLNFIQSVFCMSGALWHGSILYVWVVHNNFFSNRYVLDDYNRLYNWCKDYYLPIG